jgi:hypothetical protein
MTKTRKEEIVTPEEDIQVNPVAAMTTEEDKTEAPIVEELPKEVQIDEAVKSQKSVESKLDNLGTQMFMFIIDDLQTQKRESRFPFYMQKIR